MLVFLMSTIIDKDIFKSYSEHDFMIKVSDISCVLMSLTDIITLKWIQENECCLYCIFQKFLSTQILSLRSKFLKFGYFISLS